jgi:hypothetical protein
MQESNIHHCKNAGDGNCLYCDGDISNVIKAGGDEVSYGVMQINSNVHKREIGLRGISNFTKNVEFGVNLLIDNYNRGNIVYKYCNESKRGYIGWEAALRRYNGGKCGDEEYVERILGKGNKNNINRSEEIKELFPDLCGDGSVDA